MIDKGFPSIIDLGTRLRLGLVSSFPPTRCGIARFSASLVASLDLVAPNIETEVVRLVCSPQPEMDARASLTVQPDLPIGIRAAARKLNDMDCVVIQHEYGIFGNNDGESVLDLVERVHRPKVAVLHTVLRDPSHRQRAIIEGLAESCQLVVLSESARTALRDHYSIDADTVEVIPHGTSWTPSPPNQFPRSRLITWGLLGPGKGLERAIAALPALRDLEPCPHLQIVGRVHPNVMRVTGTAYQDSLLDLARRLGVDDMVSFIDCYLEDDELYEQVRRADIVLLPYDNREQISSGVLVEAVSAGRPVVATSFPHAVELLEPGAGIVVEHETTEMAAAIRRLLGDEVLYQRAARAAAASSFRHSWPEAALRYRALIREMVDLEAMPVSGRPESS